MGTEIRCKKCKTTLAEFDEVPTGITWYSKFRYELKGECPECGHKLPRIANYANEMKLEVKSKTPILAK